MASFPFQVLQLGPYPPPHGGVQTNLVAILRSLENLHIPCRVINLTRHRQQETGFLFFPEGALSTLRLILRLPHDIIHLHIGGMPTRRLLILGLVCCLLPGAKTVLTFHSGGFPDSPEGRTATPGSLLGIVFRRFDRLIGVNEALTDFMVRKLGAAPGKVRLIRPHALPGPPDAALLPAKIESFFQSHQPVMISLGWLEPEYDFALQIRALGPVRQRFPRAGLLILGEGRLRASLEALIASETDGQHTMIPGDVPHEIALAAIARADIFLRTTLYDGDSISVREALHFGTPVIASDNGMRPPGVHLIPRENLAALIEAICRTGAAKKQRPSGEADDRNIGEVIDLYRELRSIH